MNYVGLKAMQNACKILGPMYSIKIIDGVESIYRKINEFYDFEVCGFFGGKAITVNVWQRKPHTELMVVYSGISNVDALADVLGYLAFRCKNLKEKIQVEREDLQQ